MTRSKHRHRPEDDPEVEPSPLDVLYWRDAKKSGAVFVSLLALLYCMNNFSIVSVVANLLLALLAITFSYRVYRNVMQAIKKEPSTNPFNEYLELDVAVSEERARAALEPVLSHVNYSISKLRAVLLVQDYIESIKYGLLFWAMSCVGYWFNMMTILNLFVVGLFTLPKVYEMYKEPIDQNYNMIVGTVSSTMSSVKEKIPFLKSKPKEE